MHIMQDKNVGLFAAAMVPLLDLLHDPAYPAEHREHVHGAIQEMIITLDRQVFGDQHDQAEEVGGRLLMQIDALTFSRNAALAANETLYKEKLSLLEQVSAKQCAIDSMADRINDLQEGIRQANARETALRQDLHGTTEELDRLRGK